MDIQSKATLLAKVLEKHHPETVLHDSEQIMRNINVLNCPDDVRNRIKRMCAANIEVFKILF
jgi:hypothetical protein